MSAFRNKAPRRITHANYVSRRRVVNHKPLEQAPRRVEPLPRRKGRLGGVIAAIASVFASFNPLA